MHLTLNPVLISALKNELKYIFSLSQFSIVRFNKILIPFIVYVLIAKLSNRIEIRKICAESLVNVNQCVCNKIQIFIDHQKK